MPGPWNTEGGYQLHKTTFFTAMKWAGANNEYIQEVLRHTDKKTTENYLDSFEKDVKKDYATKLVSFKGDDVAI